VYKGQYLKGYKKVINFVSDFTTPQQDYKPIYGSYGFQGLRSDGSIAPSMNFDENPSPVRLQFDISQATEYMYGPDNFYHVDMGEYTLIVIKRNQPMEEKQGYDMWQNGKFDKEKVYFRARQYPNLNWVYYSFDSEYGTWGTHLDWE
jgi:hypothetical protein